MYKEKNTGYNADMNFTWKDKERKKPGNAGRAGRKSNWRG